MNDELTELVAVLGDKLLERGVEPGVVARLREVVDRVVWLAETRIEVKPTSRWVETSLSVVVDNMDGELRAVSRVWAPTRRFQPVFAREYLGEFPASWDRAVGPDRTMVVAMSRRPGRTAMVNAVMDVVASLAVAGGTVERRNMSGEALARVMNINPAQTTSYHRERRVNPPRNPFPPPPPPKSRRKGQR
ncbi:MAG: hypothetical protein DI536_04185 [Archangium gephyra]|uniref:Uncharacterized protein n=1 Tax=Archangium gephyra TaxID=48 RepID=A0A2W5TPC6_9BACT|nr:MAG: hypothetical protein DI536_04185 [Archangium gephyra]